MRNSIGRIIILVDDYDKASAFYEQNFGFKKIFNLTTSVGKRFLHIGNDTGVGIWFLKADTPEQQQRIGNQTAQQPLMVIYTSDIEKLYHHLKSNKVTIKNEIVSTPEYKFLHCLDLYGNEIVVVELHS